MSVLRLLPRAAVPALACLLAAGAIAAQIDERTAGRDLANWELQRQAPERLSAERILGTPVRGVNGEVIGEVTDLVVDRNGNLLQVVATSSGFLGFGARHMAVPWSHVRMQRGMAYVPISRDNMRDYLFDPRAAARAAEGAWRVSRLRGDIATLRDVRRFGVVKDVVFSAAGVVEKVIVQRIGDPLLGPMVYAYPFFGYDEGSRGYALPYSLVDLQTPPADLVLAADAEDDQ
jgi:sporulation protein YlmC with PRC-barrel domain